MFSFVNRLAQRLFPNPAHPSGSGADSQAIWVHIQCDGCGEPFALRIRKTDEIQRSEQGTDYTYFVQKQVVGSRCFRRMDMRLEFDASYRIVNQSLSRGRFLTREEYEALNH